MYSQVSITFSAEPFFGTQFGVGIRRLVNGTVLGTKSLFGYYVPAVINTPHILLPTSFTGIVGETALQNAKTAFEIYYPSYIVGTDVYPITYAMNAGALVIEIASFGSTTFEFYSLGLESSGFVLEIDNNLSDADITPLVVTPLEIEDLQIEIIDTYENNRSLVEEFTQLTSPILEWDEGDDIFESVKTSKLTFNMLVENAVDAKFIHLFTGNEKRYKVKLNSVNPSDSNDKKLIWQGYLLPDLYSEPWDNGVLFVNFEAVDMIGSLKGKYLQPWFYNNRMPVGVFLALMLEKTGLNQEIVVFPSLEPNAPGINWTDLNLPLHHYEDEGKLTDIHEMLVAFLEANALTLHSYRGYWILKGFSRKTELIHENGIVFNTSGIQTGIMTMQNKVVAPMMERTTVLLDALSPFAIVNVDFDNETEIQLIDQQCYYPETFQIKQPINDVWINSSGGNEIFNLQFFNNYPVEWKNLMDGCNVYFGWAPTVIGNMQDTTGISYDYKDTLNIVTSEGQAIQNYIELQNNIYISGNSKYKFEFEFEFVPFQNKNNPDSSYNNPDVFKQYAFFQILIDGVEIYSNRYGFEGNSIFKYELSRGNDWEYVYRLIPVDLFFKHGGNFTFRLLQPIFTYQSEGGGVYDGIRMIKIKKLSFEIIEKKLLNVVAKRDIDYTVKHEKKIKFTSYNDTSFFENIGMARCLNPSSYEKGLLEDSNYNELQYVEKTQNIQPYGLQQIQLYTYYMNKDEFLRLFSLGGRKNVYVVKDGVKIYFPDLFYARKFYVSNSQFSEIDQNGNNVEYKMAYVYQHDEYASLPKGLKAYNEVLDNEDFKMIWFRFLPENIANRAKWKIYGDTVTKEFQKAYAEMVFALRNETMFSISFNAFELLTPDRIITHAYNLENRKYYPTTLRLNLSEGQTQTKAIETKYNLVNDIVYE